MNTTVWRRSFSRRNWQVLLVVLCTLALLAGMAGTSSLPVAALTATPSPWPSATPNGPLPDLVPTFVIVSVTERNGCEAFNDPVGTRVTIQNRGGSAAGPFIVSIDGKTVQVAGLAPNATTSVWVQGYTSRPSVIVDSTNMVAENDENNNVFTGPIAISGPWPTCTRTPTGGTLTPTITRTRTHTRTGALPDLTVLNLQLFYSNCGDAAPMLQAEIANIGYADAGPFVLRLGSQHLNVSGLAAGARRQVMGPAQTTSGTFTAIVDVSQIVAESNESNNQLSKTYPAQTPCATPTRTRTRTGTGSITPLPRTATPTRTRTNTLPCGCTTQAWAPNTWYAVGARVSYGGAIYQAIQAHTSQVGWEPPNVPALWSRI